MMLISIRLWEGDLGGWVRLHRGWEDSPKFKTAAYCERAAWCWMLSNAAWKDTMRSNAKGERLIIKRGQLHVSLRSLASVWKWSKGKVGRFLDALEMDTAIERETGQSGMIVTICNYTKYQQKQDDDGTAIDPASDPATGQPRDTQEEGKEIKEEKNNNYAFSGNVIRLSEKDFQRWGKAFPDIDLRAVLQSRDDWLRDEPEASRKNWFQSTSNWLAKKQQAATTDKAEKADPWKNLEFGHA